MTRALGIDRRFNGRPAQVSSGLWIEDRGVKVPRRLVRVTPRIGVDYAGPVWAKKPWRFHFDSGGPDREVGAPPARARRAA